MTRLVAAKGFKAAILTTNSDRSLSPTTLIAETLNAKNLPVIDSPPLAADLKVYSKSRTFVCSNNSTYEPVRFAYTL